MEPEPNERAALRELADSVLGAGIWSGDVPSRPLSSIEVMRFLLKLETRFGIEVPDLELDAGNFASFTAVLRLIERSRAKSDVKR